MITIAATPRPLSWLDNHPSFTVECSGLSSGGRRASLMLRFSHSSFLYSFSIRIDGRVLTYQRYSSLSSDPYRFYNITELVQKLSSNYYIADLYTVTSSSLSAYDTVTLQSVAVARHDLALVSRSAYVSVVSLDEGEDMDTIANYGVVARFELHDGSVTPWCRYAPSNGEVRISTDQLRGFFPNPTLPNGSLSQDTNAILRYRLQVAESYGEPPVMQLITSSSWLSMMQGEVMSLFFASDIPDWKDAAPASALSFSGVRPRIIGTDNGRTYDVRQGQPYFLYALFNDTSSIPTAQATLTITVTYITTSTQVVTKTVTLSNGTLCRVNVGPSALGIPNDVRRYNIDISYSLTVIFSASFVVRVPLYQHHDYLLSDKYGLLRHVSVSGHVSSSDVEGEEATFADGRKAYVASKREQSFTATTPNLRRHEAALVADALAGRHAYARVSGQWIPITIVPGSVTSWNTLEDMIRISWQYAFIQNQRGNIASASINPSTINFDDYLDYDEELHYNQ